MLQQFLFVPPATSAYLRTNKPILGLGLEVHRAAIEGEAGAGPEETA